MIYFFYFLILFVLTFYSYGFVDANFPYKPPEFLFNLIRGQRLTSTIIYTMVIILLFVFYGRFLWLVKNKKITRQKLFQMIAGTILILLFSFSAFSYDIFNYIATAKVAFLYKENPYIVMPIEIPNESMLAFMHAANKTALYGPVWIMFTFIPHFFGFGNLLITILSFKIFVSIFYLLTLLIIWKLSSKNLFSLSLFALNPLVITETLVSTHNDIVMVFFALLSFYLVRKRIFILSFISLLFSVLIKYATIFLFPIYIYVLYNSLKNKEINWSRIWFYSFIAMLIPFFLSPIREEIYAWYFIWPLTFFSLYSKSWLNIIVVSSFCFGLELRFAPYVFAGTWEGKTPFIKKIVASLPPVLSYVFLKIKSKIS